MTLLIYVWPYWFTSDLDNLPLILDDYKILITVAVLALTKVSGVYGYLKF